MPARRAPLFLADAMLRKLARWLRLLGSKTLYASSAMGDDEIVRWALRERAVLLTRDRRLYRKARDHVPALLFETTDTPGQLTALFKTYRLSLARFLERTLCPECGSPLRVVRKLEVKSLVFPRVYQSHRRFWRCPNCGKVYWQGAHWARIRKKVAALRRALAPRPARRASSPSRTPRSAKRRA